MSGLFRIFFLLTNWSSRFTRRIFHLLLFFILFIISLFFLFRAGPSFLLVQLAVSLVIKNNNIVHLCCLYLRLPFALQSLRTRLALLYALFFLVARSSSPSLLKPLAILPIKHNKREKWIKNFENCVILGSFCKKMGRAVMLLLFLLFCLALHAVLSFFYELLIRITFCISFEALKTFFRTLLSLAHMMAWWAWRIRIGTRCWCETMQFLRQLN